MAQPNKTKSVLATIVAEQKHKNTKLKVKTMPSRVVCYDKPVIETLQDQPVSTKRKRVYYTKEREAKFVKLCRKIIFLSFFGGLVSGFLLTAAWNSSKSWKAYNNGVRAGGKAQ